MTGDGITADDWAVMRAIVDALPPIPDETLDEIATILATVRVAKDSTDSLAA